MKKTLFIIILCVFSSLIWAQDLIITKDAKRIEAKILEVSKSEIKYKDWSYTEGPTFVLDTREITSVVYSNGSVQLFDEQPTVPQSVTEATTPQLTSNQPNVDLSNFHGLLIAEGNCVFVPTDSQIDYEQAGQQTLKDYLRSDGFWKVVDNIDQAHFVIQYGVCLKGEDRAFMYFRSVSSYQSIPNLTYDIWNYKVIEPQSAIFTVMSTSEDPADNVKAAENAVSHSLPYWKERLRKPGWLDKREAKRIKENLWIP